MKKILFFLFLTASLSLNAEVMVYKFTQTNTWTGDGAKFKSVVAGRLVFDPAAADTAQVFTWLPSQRFQVDCPFLTASYMMGPRRSDEAAFFLDGVGYDALGRQVSITYTYLRGTNTSLLIGVNRHISAPKVLRGVSRVSYTGADGTTYVGEGKIVATFYGGDTRAANAQSMSVEEVIQSYRQTYLGAGWIEVVGDAPCP